jgi:uncharacterized protein (UPF0264 family)
MAGLLVSVRSVEEAAAALEGGADLIDVKEPSRGSLGRADEDIIRDVIDFVAGRRPVSAAYGELLDAAGSCVPISGLAFVKWGLAGVGSGHDWRDSLTQTANGLRGTACQAVATAYADWQRAESPPPDSVCAFACDGGIGAFLLDTWRKDSRTLLDFLTQAEVANMVRRCRAAGVRVALAGSLRAAQIRELRLALPDWFAVRGAVCSGGDRCAAVDAAAVRALADSLLPLPGSCNAATLPPKRFSGIGQGGE